MEPGHREKRDHFIVTEKMPLTSTIIMTLQASVGGVIGMNGGTKQQLHPWGNVLSSISHRHFSAFQASKGLAGKHKQHPQSGPAVAAFDPFNRQGI